MALNPDIRDQAYQFFIEEAPELLQVIEAGLLTLRGDRTTAKIHDLMRAAHSLKGGAASVELEAIKTLAHRLENIFKALYDETIAIDTNLESQLLQAYDCLRLPLMEQISTGYFDGAHALELADPIFAQIEERLGDALNRGDTYIPSSSELGIDMTTSIFEVDVGQGLEHLAQIVAHPQEYEVAGELRAQAEVFAGFAELLNLPGFGAIAQTTLRALAAHPNRALQIAQLALIDFEFSRQAVLSGDRSQGGSPSSALVALAESREEREIPDITTIPVAYSVSEDLPVVKEQPETLTALEDIFSDLASIADTESIVDSVSDSEPMVLELSASKEIASETPSLAEVFGSAIEASDTEAESVGEEIAPEVPSLVDSQSLTPESLETALTSLGQIIDNLPSVEDIAIPTPATSKTANLVPTPSSSEPISHKAQPISADIAQPEASVTPNLTVRVDSERLERMNNLVGELAINRNGLSLQNQQLQKAVRELLDRFSRVQNVVGQLQELSDQMLAGTSSSGSIALHPSFWSVFGNGEISGANPFDNNVLAEMGWPLPKAGFGNRETLHNSEFDSLELDSYGVLNSRLQGLIEDMVQLEEAVDDVALFAKQSDQTLEQQRQMLTQLRDELMWARMLPLGEVINRFPRILRDLSATYHKSVSLKLSGTGVLVDKAALEKLYDPLLHLLRNAFDHGIESPEIRRQQGKTEQGQIEIRAYHQGSQTIIEVRDNGQGVNTERIGCRAVELGLLSAEQLTTVSDSHLYELLFEPGFSTAERVSELSGRGVGLDVVRSQMRSLKGNITVTSSPGVGTTFTLRLPLTLTIAKLLVCFIGTTAVALPSDSVEEIVVPKSDQVKTTGQQRFLSWREQIVPAYRLADILKYACPFPENSPTKALLSVPSPQDWALPMLILRQEQHVLALEIDRLVTEQELVIKPFSSTIAPPAVTYGCTILGDGSLIPVIDGAVLMSQLLGQSAKAIAISSDTKPLFLSINASSSMGKTEAGIKTAKTPTVLVVDDAAALRRTLALTLERAGCRVLQARDGREALEQLRQGSRVDLVICDIEMPNMNGFEFLGQRRQEPQLLLIPVVMLTSRSNDKHRWLAMHLGATAYFTKPYLEQEFLMAIKDIIHEQNSEQKRSIQLV
ncbi:MAG TPA: hybrid sensor histidine kinase/response regulator [Cyanobacteria bacterium UBA8803]|nr:hybrid sensor histidine kinase/response regulator [Cyanobacteria bacterium UBA9273]HBL58485.1 hybrid sensor histidine kinase/response regulator [Cyanobacteria bacterium UBA8803]